MSLPVTILIAAAMLAWAVAPCFKQRGSRYSGSRAVRLAVLGSTACEMAVRQAYRTHLESRLITFFLNSMTDPQGAEEYFRNGLRELTEARDRALEILNTTKGV